MMSIRQRGARGAGLGVAALAGLAVLAVAAPAHGQAQDTRANPETTPRERLIKDAGKEPGPIHMSDFGEDLSNAQAAALLREMRQLTEQALAASRAAEQAGSVAEVKAAADRVLQAVWGLPSGVDTQGTGEIEVPGWKERWQVTGAEFDPRFAQRLGTEAPRITDPSQLGIMGRGRAVRGRLIRLANLPSATPASATAAENTIAAINNVIGWMYITTGYKGREVQPRISLTYVWDAPTEFWNTTSDTGWLAEAYSQAVNILKTDYAGDAAEARKHAAGMTAALQRSLAGVDQDKNGAVEAKMMEGGLTAALAEAARAGFPTN